MHRFLLTLGTALLATLPLARSASAHDPGLSSLRIEVTEERIEATLHAATNVLARFADLDEALSIESDGIALDLLTSNLKKPVDDRSELRLEFARKGGRSLRVASNLLASFPPGHKQFVRLVTRDSEVLASRILSEGDASFEVRLPLPRPAAPRSELISSGASTVSNFFWVGVEHIATGFDHLLFLAALLLASRGFGGAARIITAFTVAHSITLIAAITGFVEFNPSWVESLIAASIVFAAALNLLGGQAAHRRVAVALGFGLIHGLGFAGLLEELDLAGAGASLWPLVGFNLGVEAGQLAFALPLLAAIAWLRPRFYFQQRLVPALSVLIGAFGLVWLAERTALL